MNNIINLQAVRERKEALAHWEKRTHSCLQRSGPCYTPKTREDLVVDVKRHYSNYVRQHNTDDIQLY